MAVTRIWKVEGRLEHPINYVKNEEKTSNPRYTKEELDSLQDVMDYTSNAEKTEKKFFVTGVNCNASTAREQFLTVKKQFGKEGGIVAYHAYQSFAEGEVTPEIAHAIGVEFAKEVWGEEYQVLVATHLNTKCLHNHFVINSVSFRHGRRCRAKQWKELSRISDEICKKHELSVIEHPLGKRMSYTLAVAEKVGRPTRLNMAKEAVDTAISQSCNMREFSIILKEMGYICQFRYDRKYWTIKQKDWQRPIRLARLGEDYTNERIEERVLANTPEVRMKQMTARARRRQCYRLPTREDRLKKIGGLKGLYLYYCYKLGYLPKYQQSAAKVHYLYRDDLLKMERISEESRLLVRENISTKEELKQYRLRLEANEDETISCRTILRNLLKHKDKSEGEKQELREEIAELSDTLKTIRKEIRMCISIAERSEKMKEKINKEELEIELEKRKER